MRPPTRIASHPPNPYDELALLAEPEPDYAEHPEPIDTDDPLGLGLAPDDDGRDGRDDRDHDDDEWKPPNHRGKSRLAAVPFVLKLAVTGLVCASLLLACDRFAVLYAQDKAEEKLQQSLGLAASPEVEIHGFPFLTQVAARRLDRVDVTVPDVAADRVSLAEVRATAQDIRVVGSLPTSIRGAVVGSVDGDVLLSFDDLGRELGASQAKFTKDGDNRVRVAGSLPVAGHEVRVRAEAHIRRDGDRAVSTTVDHMRLDIPGLVTYRPGKDRAHSGLRLHPEAAARISREAAQIKALLAVPAVAERLGVRQEWVERALRSEKELHELTGSPRFVRQLMQLNLVDVVMDHPWLLEKAGIDPKLVGALLSLRPPELSERLSLSFRLPKTPGELRLRGIGVEREGIRADLAGTGLTFGNLTSGKE
ncbi:LmeA family phospholipid-binding protein [Streptomyces sp. NPDC055287]